jgi:amidase
MLKGNGMGTNWKGYYTTGLMDVFARGWKTRPDDLSETAKLVLLTGEYMHTRYHGRFYAKAQNLALKLKAAYDTAFEQVDLLLMPTLPMKAACATRLRKPAIVYPADPPLVSRRAAGRAL